MDKRYSPQPEILQYINIVYKKYDLAQHIIFDWEVKPLNTMKKGVWELTNQRKEKLTANIGVGNGPLHIQVYPI